MTKDKTETGTQSESDWDSDVEQEQTDQFLKPNEMIELVDMTYGQTVSNCSLAVRNRFIRKVYLILTLQLAFTAGFCCFFLFFEPARQWAQLHYYFVWLNLIPTLAILYLLHRSRTRFPSNLILLALFTLLESYSVGMIVSFYEVDIVMQAVLVTAAVFLGLTSFCLQTKYDFSSWGAPCSGLLFGFVIALLLRLWFPSNSTLELILGAVGVVLFSAYILYDTHRILKRLAVEEYVEAAVSLYLDIINLFLSFLRILGH
eukprot:Lithocolla_globosa_v1_NODE_2681_length_1906_cov_23.872501.p1 type:complete len:259 gc:universal NODE_2681_length_1906_cov_23.872501:875-1651(+)